MPPSKKKGRGKGEFKRFLESLVGKRVRVPVESIPPPIPDAADETGVAGRVRALDKVHPGCLIVKLEGDARRFFFAAQNVTEWLVDYVPQPPSSYPAGPHGQQPSPCDVNGRSLDCLAEVALMESEEHEPGQWTGSHEVSSADHDQHMEAPDGDQPSQHVPEATLRPSPGGDLLMHGEDAQSPRGGGVDQEHKRSSEELEFTGLQGQQGNNQHAEWHAWAMPQHSEPQSHADQDLASDPDHAASGDLRPPSPSAALSEPQLQHPPKPGSFTFVTTPSGLVPVVRTAAVSAPPAQQQLPAPSQAPVPEEPTCFIHRWLYKGEADQLRDGLTPLSQPPPAPVRHPAGVLQPSRLGPHKAPLKSDSAVSLRAAGVQKRTSAGAATSGGSGAVAKDTPGDRGLSHWKKPVRGYTKRKAVADLIGKLLSGVLQLVEIPGPIFGVDIPDVYYRGKITGPDTEHADAVVVRMVEDKARFYFPTGQVREWLQWQQERETEGSPMDHDHTTGVGADSFAAEVLTQMSTGQTTSLGSHMSQRVKGTAAAARAEHQADKLREEARKAVTLTV